MYEFNYSCARSTMIAQMIPWACIDIHRAITWISRGGWNIFHRSQKPPFKHTVPVIGYLHMFPGVARQRSLLCVGKAHIITSPAR